jgi:hypothetical protein
VSSKLQATGAIISITGLEGRKRDAKVSGLGAREMTLFRSHTIYRGPTTNQTTKQEQTTVCICDYQKMTLAWFSQIETAVINLSLLARYNIILIIHAYILVVTNFSGNPKNSKLF